MVSTKSSTANDKMASMEVQNAIPSTIQRHQQQLGVSEFYHGKTVFITGGTGFMGKVLLEKLLRACPGLARVYLLIRPKKGQDARERLQQLLCSPVSYRKKLGSKGRTDDFCMSSSSTQFGRNVPPT